MKARRHGLRWLCGGLLVATSLSGQANVILGGKEWLQPADFTNLSWNDIADVCDPVLGVCIGTLNGFSLDGWTWASAQDVGALFAAAGIPGFNDPFGPTVFLEANSDWAPAFIDYDGPNGPDTGYFYSTFQVLDPESYSVFAFSRSELPNNALFGNRPSVTDFTDPEIADRASTNGYVQKDGFGPSTGAWFFRVHQIPEPGTLALLGFGLAGLGLLRRRRRV